MSASFQPTTSRPHQRPRSYFHAVLLALALVTAARADQLEANFTRITTGPLATDLGTSWGGWGDFDGDGFPDVFVMRWNSGLSTLYHNNQDGTFSIATGLPSQSSPDTWTDAAIADFDNDGKQDLYLPRDNKPGVFYFNNGDGTFATKEFQTANLWNTAVADYDRDGLLDLFLSNVGGLFHNDGNRTFAPVTRMGAGMLGGAIWADYDDDGLLELFCGSNPGTTQIWHNDGTGQFLPVNNLITQGKSFGGAWGDYDNDGRLDFCALFSPTTYLYHNLGNGKFEGAATGLVLNGNYRGACWGDYDNDGFLDLFLVRVPNPNELYHNNGDGTFTQVTTGSPVTDIPNGDAGSYFGFWFDYDNDGFLDLFVPNGNDPGTAETTNFLYHNNGNKNAWLKVKLIGTVSNHDGIGAKVRVQARYAGQSRWQRRDISAGEVATGNSLIAHFGLGDANNVAMLRIEWPSGTVQELQNIAPKQYLTVWEPPALRAAVQPDGACNLTVVAQPNRAWRIEASADLAHWQELATVNTASSTLTYFDTATPHSGCRFYRVVASPVD